MLMPSCVPMSSSLINIPSPCSETFDLAVQPEHKPRPPASMLKIQSLLNPHPDHNNNSHRYPSEPVSTPPTPAYTAHGSSTRASTARPTTPTTPTPPSKRQKMVKDAAVFVRGEVKGTVHFPPFECTEHSDCLTVEEQDELAVQHRRLEVSPSGHGHRNHISDFVRHIPYASEKKSFMDKTGRDGFDVFQYTFTVPGDSDKRKHVVMWDYHIGLVRITPFFKACKYSKTTPAKSLTTNPGLKDLSHSITGGALAAQGYWMPYACARAVCLTFCHPIRWALTPIFGLSFIRECLRPEDVGFARFKIDPEVIRCATLEAQSWKPVEQASASSNTPVHDVSKSDIPRSAPQEPSHANRPLRSRIDEPRFQARSPFDSQAERRSSRDHRHTYAYDALDSPQLSPKTRHAALPVTSGQWTSINSSPYQEHPLPNNIPTGGMSVLPEPHFSSPATWRGAGDEEGMTAWEPPTSLPLYQPPAAAAPVTGLPPYPQSPSANLPLYQPPSAPAARAVPTSVALTPSPTDHHMTTRRSLASSQAAAAMAARRESEPESIPTVAVAYEEVRAYSSSPPALDDSKLTSETGNRSTSESESESDDEDIPTTGTKKRKIWAPSSLSSVRMKKSFKGKAKANADESIDTSRLIKFAAEDARAAHWLLNLRKRDQELAARQVVMGLGDGGGGGGGGGRKRKAGGDDGE